MRNVYLRIWVMLVMLFHTAVAKRKLSATSLVTCMEGSQLAASSFDVVFNPDDRSLHYTLDMTTEISGYVTAYAEVYAYGFKIITKSIDLCSLNWKQFCPVYPGDIQVDSIEYISEEYTKQIPGIAYQVPDIDAYVKITVFNNNTQQMACIQAFFSNGKTVSQVGVKWATAVIAGIGLLVSAVLSTFGNSNAASHIAANTMSLFLYFQSVVVVSMEHVHRVPPIAAAWSENLIWSMGLIRVSFMQKIFRWYVQSTGGTPMLYLTSTTISVLAQRSWDYLTSTQLYRRAEEVLYGNSNVLIFRGIKRLAYRVHIENTSVVCTGFTFFVLCGYVLAGFIIFSKYAIELCIRVGWMKNSRFIDFRKNWRIILKGSLLRYIYIGFTQLTILCFWEFVQNDSPAVIVLAVLFLLLSLGIMLWAAYRTITFARSSIQLHNNPAALLYGDQTVLNKYGFFYTMYNATHYWWSCVMLTYILLKSIFISFAQASGKTQALAIFIIDLAYFGILIYYQPYLDRATNILNILITTVTLVNSFLFMFFSDLFGQPGSVSSIMGWIFFILNAAFSLILLILILVYVGLVVFSKNPDLRFKPAKDDRTSFQRNSANVGTINQSVAAELLALGNTAKDHKDNWEDELYNQKQNPGDQSESGIEYADEKLATAASSNREHTDENGKPTLAEKLKSKLLKRNKSTSSKEKLEDDHVPDLGPEYPITSLSRDPSTRSTSPIRKAYPGVHKRQESESKNGLMNSFDDEEQIFSTSEAPNTSGHFTSEAKRDESLDSVAPNATSSTDLFTHNNNSYYGRL